MIDDAPLSTDLGSHPRIGVVKLADLGDVLIVTPLLSALRTRYPDAVMHAIVTPNGSRALATNPDVDGLVLLDRGTGPWSKRLSGPLMAARVALLFLAVHRLRLDALIIAHHLTRRRGARFYRTLAHASNAPVTVGLDNGRGGFFTHPIRDHGFGHVPEWRYWLKLGQLLDAEPSARPIFPITPEADAEADRLLRDHRDEPFVAIHPVVGAYGPGRAWPVARFANLASALRHHFGYRVVLVGGPDAVAAGQQILRSTTTVLDLTGRTSFAGLGAILSRAALTIGADSAAVHLSATLGRPTLAIFGPSNHLAWAPYGATFLHIGEPLPEILERVVVVRSDLPCAPCFYIGHGLGRPVGCSTRSCLVDVTDHAVFDVARGMLMAHVG